MKIQEQFVPFEESKELGELGFNGHCLAKVSSIEAIHIKGTRRLPGGAMCTDEVNAPTYQQAFDFFEDKFKLYSSQENLILDFCVSSADGEIKILKPLHTGEHFKNRQEVRLERLRFLIKTVKGWKQTK